MPNPIALRVRAALAEEGVRQKDVATLLGLSQAQVSARLTGLVEFRPSELTLVAEHLRVPVQRFFEQVAA